MDLFESAAEDHLRSVGPLAARMRPRSLEDVIGQQHLLGPGAPLRQLVSKDALRSLILWGPAGTGKTTIALAIAASTKSEFEQLSAVTAGVKDVREVIERARIALGSQGRRTILFLDEIHRFSKSQQDALLPSVENGTLVLIGATTENPYFEVNSALLSRSVLFRLSLLERADMLTLLERALKVLGATARVEALDALVDRSGGDARRALTLLDVANAVSGGEITLEDVDNASGTSGRGYGVDEHYDVVSAFIKSMRASDPQASVLYLARMLSAGEDPRFICRRMIIFASEDVGLADPHALSITVSAAQALEHVGLPEAQLNIAQAAIYLALAPKSRSVADAIGAALADFASGLTVEVPPRLRDAHYAGAIELGHGVGYAIPDEESRALPGHFLPEGLIGRRWYEPSSKGWEAHMTSSSGRESEQGESS